MHFDRFEDRRLLLPPLFVFGIASSFFATAEKSAIILGRR